MYKIPQTFAPFIKQYITQGDNHLKENKIKTALQYYYRALVQVSNNHFYYYMLIHIKMGIAYSKQNFFSLANSCFDEAERYYMPIHKNNNILPTTFLGYATTIINNKAANFLRMIEQANFPVEGKIFYYDKIIKTYTGHINVLVNAIKSSAKNLKKQHIECLLDRGKIFKMWANLLPEPNSKPLLICAYKDFDMAVNMSKEIKDQELTQNAMVWRQNLVREN